MMNLPLRYSKGGEIGRGTLPETGVVSPPPHAPPANILFQGNKLRRDKSEVEGLHAILLDCPICGHLSVSYDYTETTWNGKEKISIENVFTCKHNSRVIYKKKFQRQEDGSFILKRLDSKQYPPRYTQPCKGRIIL